MRYLGITHRFSVARALAIGVTAIVPAALSAADTPPQASTDTAL
jgi:hypothetical protein